MPTPRKGYFLDSIAVPTTTQICNAYKESGALIHWAWTEGKAGRDYKESRDKAGGIGTAAHEMIEAAIRGVTIPEGPPEAHKAFAAYRAWEKKNNIKIIESEIQLVSREYRYGGTPDAIGLFNDQRFLLDWKTSKGVYKSYILQLAAYRQLWNENFPDMPVESAYLIRFSKTDAVCEPYYFGGLNLEAAWEQFKLFRQAYDMEDRLDAILEGARSCMKPLSQ